LEEYHKDQDIDAPFKKSEIRTLHAARGFRFYLTMQKDLSDWINISKIEIDAKTVKEISESITEE
jgi:hypothetical protein